MSEEKAILEHLERVAAALDRMAPPPPARADFGAAEAFVWQASPEAFLPVANVNLDFVDVATGIKIDTPGDITGVDGTYQVQVPVGAWKNGVTLGCMATPYCRADRDNISGC